MLLQNGADPSLKANDGFSLVHCALKGGNTSIINELLSRGLEADSRSNDYSTPLMAAAIGDKQNVFPMLIQKGADPSLKVVSSVCCTVLQRVKLTSIIYYLLSRGLDVNSRNSIVVTPLMMTAAIGDKESAFEMLI